MNHVRLAAREAVAAPRSIGALRLSTKRVSGRSCIEKFRTSGATKVAFPRRADAVEAIMLNTSGGLTGGDRFEASAHAGPESTLILTTQAAERGYRSQSGTARVTTRLTASEGSSLRWLPQELILFDGTRIDRKLSVDLAQGAELVLVEPVVFGRMAMGETLTSGWFRDTITIRRQGAPLFWDRVHLSGRITEHLARAAVARGMAAMASAVFVGPRAETLLPVVRRALPETGGASLLGPDLLSIRLLAADSYLLRRAMVPILEALTGDTLPKSWSL